MSSSWASILGVTSSSLSSCPDRTAATQGTYVPPSNGITGGYTGNNQTIIRAMTAFTAIAWYNAIELIFITLFRFKKHEGLYFWSLLVTAFAIIVYATGSWGNMFQIAGTCYPNVLIMLTLQNVGWIFMVSGQSLVLYSRLHIIVINNTRLLKFVLWLVIIDAFILYIPTTVLNYGTVIKMTKTYTDGYNTMERIQMTLFSVQEIGISAIYLWEVRKFLRNWGEDTRKLMIELIAVNIALILLDVALLSVEFENLYQIETTLKGMVYSIKLKLEIGVLSRMVKVVETRKKQRTMPAREEDIDPRKYSSAATFREYFAEDQRKHISESSDSSPYRQPISEGHEDIKLVSTRGTENRKDSLVIPPNAASTLGTFPTARSSEASRQSSIQDLYPGRIKG